MTANSMETFSRWLESKPERWTLLNIVMLTVVLILLGPDSWVARILSYGAVCAVLAWRLLLAWNEARALGLSLFAAAARGVSGFGLVVLCAATAVFANEYSEGLMFPLACILFGFQLYFFRLFSEKDGTPHK